MYTSKVVVAKYKEDISWLDPIRDKCIIYDKSKDYPNVGRESETYLRYIIENYDNLPDIVVFTQANIADHRGSNDVRYLNMLEMIASKHGCSFPVIASNDWVWGPDFNFNKNNSDEYRDPNNYHDGKVISFYQYFKNNFGANEYPYPLLVYPNALFAVSKELILKRPKKFYETLNSTVNYSKWPVEGHFMERCWYYIFNFDKSDHLAYISLNDHKNVYKIRQNI